MKNLHLCCNKNKKGRSVSIPLRGKGYEKRRRGTRMVKSFHVSIPLRGKGYEKPYTHGNLVTFSFQRAFAPSYGNKDVTSKASIQFSWYRLLFPANKNNLTEKLPDVNPKN